MFRYRKCHMSAALLCGTIVTLTAVYLGSGHAISMYKLKILLANYPFLPSSTSTGTTCDQKYRYTTEILSLDPLMIYINDFLTDFEVEHLLRIGNDSYDGRLFVSEPLENGRSPLSGALNKSDPVVACVGNRAMQFLGYLDHDDYETPWLAKYAPLQMVNPHWDPPEDSMIDSEGEPYNWLSSFFVYLQASGIGGETYFPRFKALPVAVYATDSRFSDTGGSMGIAVKPIPKNAIFWVNMFLNGTRDSRTLHAGATLEEGTKIGMNIWAKQYRWPV